MRLFSIRGVIDRRILVNYRVDPGVLAGLLPAPFRPRLVQGHGLAGICLIRLKAVRPRSFPSILGLTSENAAHRIAVEWDQDGIQREGVFVPRRDTSSRLNVALAGRLFAGVQHHARFHVQEHDGNYQIDVQGHGHMLKVAVEGRVTTGWPQASVFGSLSEASSFFEGGSLGYSPARRPGDFDGIELRCFGWQVEPLAIERVESSFFDDRSRFPAGSVQVDCGLLMRGIPHEWHRVEAAARSGPMPRKAGRTAKIA